MHLPPAYLTSQRPLLPVLVVLSGQPSSPRDWLDGGRLAAVLDRHAAAHDGLAPVVVMPDPLGSTLANPLCLDSRLGRVQTYLSVDVPAWIRASLQVDPDPHSWAVAGSSAGGTCALQLALTAPRVYPTFLDIAGQTEPTLGSRARTVAAAFGGDTAAFTAVNPLDLLAHHRYPDTAGFFIVGRGDAVYGRRPSCSPGPPARPGCASTTASCPAGTTGACRGPGWRPRCPGWRAGCT